MTTGGSAHAKQATDVGAAYLMLMAGMRKVDYLELEGGCRRIEHVVRRHRWSGALDEFR